MFGPGTAGKRPVGDESIAGSECEPWSSSLLPGCCRTIQSDKQEERKRGGLWIKKSKFKIMATAEHLLNQQKSK